MTLPDRSCSSLNVFLRPDGSSGIGSRFYDAGHQAKQINADGTVNLAGIGSSGMYAAAYRITLAAANTRNRVVAQFPGGGSDLIGVKQSYPNAGGRSVSIGSAWDGIISDRGILAPSTGAAVEHPSQDLGSSYTKTLQSGTSGVYLMSGISAGTIDTKLRPFVTWAGKYHLRDISSTAQGDVITDSTPFTLCHVLVAGECRSGSAVGQTYVSVPGADSSTVCKSGQVTFRSICIASGAPSLGQVMQMRLDRSDPSGVLQRSLGYGLTDPGSQYPYAASPISSDGKAIYWTAYNLENLYSAVILAKTSTNLSTRNPTTYTPVTINSGSNFYVEFGYEENGPMGSFYCMQRGEKCRARAAAMASPWFMWARENDSNTPISSTVQFPGIPGRMLFSRRCSAGGICDPIDVTPVQ